MQASEIKPTEIAGVFLMGDLASFKQKICNLEAYKSWITISQSFS